MKSSEKLIVSERLYVPSTAEQEMLESAEDIFHREAQFGPGKWPAIVEDERLPAAVLELVGRQWSEEWDELQNADAAGKNENAPIRIYILDNVLGTYDPHLKKITLFSRMIRSFAKYAGVEDSDVFTVVLLHEFGHWITHCLPHDKQHEWPIASFLEAERAVKEGWAELISWWIALDVGKGLERVHEILNTGQPPDSPYLRHKIMIKYKKHNVCQSLIPLRKLPKADWSAWGTVMRDITVDTDLEDYFQSAEDFVF